MAKNKTTYTLEIDAELGSLEHKLATVKELLSGVLGSDKAPKGLEKAFEKIEGIIDKVKAKASEPITTKAGFSSITKDVDSAQVALASLLKIVNSIASMPEADRLSFLPPDAQAQIEKIVSSLSDYATAMDAAATESEELATARTKLAQAEERVATAQAKVNSKQASLEAAKAEKTAAEQGIALIEERKRKLEELREEQQKIEDFYNTPNEDGTKKNRSKKYDGVSMRPQDIKRQIRELEEASASDEVALEGFNEKLKQSKEDIRSYQTQVNTANRALRESKTEHEALTRKVEELEAAFETGKVRDQQAAFATLRREAEALGVDLDGISESYSERDASELISRITALKTKGFDKIKTAVNDAKENLDEFGETCKGVKGEVEAGTEAFEEMSEAASQQKAFENKIKSFLGIQGAAQLMRAALRDAMQTITDLDATMADMAVVTDLDISDYWNQLPQYTQRANELGLAIGDVYKADTLFYQQGLKTNEVVAISTETMKMASIAGLDTAEATDRMTAALRGFNMELNEASAQKIADVYSELAAITAADVDEISTAMTKTASIASSAGMEFETTAAFLSQIIETTRESAETAGTAMKTVIARFQELKKSPDEIGEVDGEIVDANAIETALRSVGVSLRDAGGQFRELDDVFLELSSKWDGLDKNTQRYIATIAAGSRQQSRFIAMMSDYQRTTELVTAANNSAGASQEQFEKKAESLEFKINQLKNAWHEFTMGIMESDLVKFGVDILTKFLEIVNKATDGLGDKGFGGALMKIVGVFAIFKMGMKIFNKFEAPIMSLFKKVTEWAGIEGFKSGKTYAEAAERGATSVTSGVEGTSTSKAPSEDTGAKTDEHGFVAKMSGAKKGVKDLFGRDGSVKKSRDYLSSLKEAESKKSREQKVFDAEMSKDLAVRGGASPEEIAAADEELKNAKISLQEYTDAEEDLKTKSKGAWEGIAGGIGAAGEALTGVGMGVSMVGGLLSSMGLEEAGSVISDIGQAITMVGGALSIIPPILTLISSHPIIAIITAALLVIMALVVGIVSYIKNNSPEKKLEDATKNAEAAAEAAQLAKENYEALSDSLDSLGDKQKELENLTRGTDEWNKAVQDVNASVLDLIDKYPELAGFVENEGGVLTLDVESDEVQAVLREQEKGAIAAKGAEIGAKAAQNRAQLEYDLSKMDDKVFDKFKSDDGGKAAWTAVGNLAAATAAGAAVGAGTGAALGLAATPFGSAAGAVGGAIIGGVAGLTAGLATFQYTMDQVEKNNEQNRENVKELAQAYANGETGESVSEIAAYIERNGIAVGDAAEQMAKSLVEESETMLEFGQALNATDAAQKAYYQAMATNAQQLIDLGAHSEQQIDQMNTVVDEDLMKAYEDQRKAELTTMKDEKGQEQFNQAKADFVKQQYGSNARVEGNKVLDEKGEVIREFTNDDAWIAEMAAADATLHAAEAMAMVPDIINDNMKIVAENFGVEAQKAFEKAFSGQDLTKGELSQFEETLGDFYYNYTDAEGTTHSGTIDDAWAALDANSQSVWGSKEAYARSLDKDYKGVKDLWKEMSNEQKEAVYGGTDEAAYERFEATFTEILDEQTKAFSIADKNIKSMLGETGAYSEKLSSVAAQAWTNNLKDIYSAGGDIDGLNNELTQLLEGMTAEEANAAMAQINVIDKMNIDAWEDLSYVFENLGINYNTEALNEFIEKGKEVSGAIRKIDFTTLANDINETYKLLDKVKEGGRTYSEEDYKQLIAANKTLEKSFTKIGDEFIYVGGSMETLTDALQKNTIAVLQDANAQLKNKIEMGEIVKEVAKAENLGSVEAMSDDQLENYLITMRSAFVESGKDLASLGIEGLSMNTSFIGASTEDLKKWAMAIAQLGGSLDIFKEDYTEGLRQANIQRYVRNDASYNAQIAAEGGEYADEHQEALILQAIQSGGVSNAMIEAYRKAIEDGNEEEISRIGEQIATATEKIVEASEGRDAYQDLVERVTDAIIDARQKEIDKLSEVNDSINSANDKLVEKLQQQIDEERQARDNEKTEQALEDLYNQRALLTAQSSVSLSELLELDKQIAEAEEDYQNNLVDQAIQNLQDANAQAAEQRERQISVMEQQLQWEQENGLTTAQAERIVASSLEAINNGEEPLNTQMGKLLWGAEGENKGLGELAKENWVKELQQVSAMAANWLQDQGMVKANSSGETFDSLMYDYQTQAQKEINNNQYADISSGSKGHEAIKAAHKAYQDAGGTATLETFSSGIKAYSGSGTTKDDALESGLNAVKASNLGFRGIQNNTDYKKAKEDYVAAGGTAEHFDAIIAKEAKDDGMTGHFPNDSGVWKWDDDVHSSWWSAYVKFGGKEVGAVGIKKYHIAQQEGDPWLNKETQDAITKISGSTPGEGWLAMYQGEPYIYTGNYWAKVQQGHTHEPYNEGYRNLKRLMQDYLTTYKTGGSVNFTGPAWLDGTPSRPEYILNAAQTERFFSLVDVLEGIDTKDSGKKSTGDNYFDIEINVDKLENDYDVEQVADKIRRMIYEDATYRNVNAINHIR